MSPLSVGAMEGSTTLSLTPWESRNQTNPLSTSFYTFVTVISLEIFEFLLVQNAIHWIPANPSLGVDNKIKRYHANVVNSMDVCVILEVTYVILVDVRWHHPTDITSLWPALAHMLCYSCGRSVHPHCNHMVEVLLMVSVFNKGLSS